MRYDNRISDRTTGSYGPPRKSGNKTALVVSITVILCVALIAGTVLFIFLWQKNHKDSADNASTSERLISSDSDTASSAEKAAAAAVEENDDQQNGSSKNILYNTLCKEYVTLRSSTSMESSAVTTIPKGETVEIVNTVKDSTFIHVAYNGYEGYVLSAFFTDSPDAGSKYVMYCGARQYANLRSRPGSNNADNIDTILTNEPVQCTGSYEYVDGQKYLECLFKGQTGYVLADVMNYDQKGSTYKGN